MKKSKREKNDQSWFSDQHGQAVLEFALLMPILLFLLFAIFTVGYWMNAQQIVTQAAMQGARQGALTNDDLQITSAIVANMKALDSDIDKNPPQPRTIVDIQPRDPAIRKRGSALTISINYTMPFGFDMLPGNFKTVKATIVSQMQCEPAPGDTVCPP